MVNHLGRTCGISSVGGWGGGNGQLAMLQPGAGCPALGPLGHVTTGGVGVVGGGVITVGGGVPQGPMVTALCVFGLAVQTDGNYIYGIA